MSRFLLFAFMFVGAGQGVAQQDAQAIELVPASPELQRVRTLIRANVLDLAQRIMEFEGPPLIANGEWFNWERQLWSLYAARGNWQALYDRVQSIPPSFPPVVKASGDRQAIKALIALKDGAGARRLLRRALLSNLASEVDKVNLRKLLIESYLADGLMDEANISAKAFQQDYRSQENDWLLLAAQIALRSGNPNEAVNLLAPMSDPEARILRTYARLKNGSLGPSGVITVAKQFLALDEFESYQKSLLGLMAAAADTGGLLVQRADYIEQYLIADNSVSLALNTALPAYTVSQLMTAYSAIAREQANEAGYLQGEESSWRNFAVAIPLQETVKRRSVWAYIRLLSSDAFMQKLAVDNFIAAVMDGERTPLIHQLFGEEGALGALILSPSTGLRLSNIAIEKGDVQLAANANANVLGLPEGMSFNEWLLYTGRIAIIAGRYEKGAVQIDQWLDTYAVLTPEQTDTVLQPLFDLQTVDQHLVAIPLLEKVNARSPGGKYRREIAYWLAESYSATNQYVKAADYFLFSALQKDNGFDQWGESARFRAAEALLAGNFFADSRALFESLLKRATQDARKQSLRQKLQQLWLKESSFNVVSGGTSN